MRLFSFTFMFAAALAARAADSSTVFPIKIGRPAQPAEVAIFWGADSPKSISVNDDKGKLLQNIDPSGDWTNLGSESDRTRKDIVLSVDANFDGFPDLLIEASNGTAGRLFKMFKYDVKTKIFESCTDLDKIWNPKFDEKRKVITGGPSDMKPKTYYWKNNS